MKKPFATILLGGIAAFAFGVRAETINYSKIGSGEQGFRQYWQLNEDEARRYHNYMEVAGKYRHKDVNPLTVLSMIAESSEDKSYYARKAAEYEHQMVMREIETAWLVSSAMSESYLADAMQTFTDNLTGISTLDYEPAGSREVVWQDGDQWVLFLDEQCLTVKCVNQFLISPPPELSQHNISRRVVLKTDKPLEASAQKLLEAQAGLQISRFDPLEHRYLDNLRANQALHVRDGQMLAVVPVGESASPAKADLKDTAIPGEKS